jgi:hypothetical protein
MRDSAPLSALAGTYSSAGLLAATRFRRARIVPFALVAGGGTGMAHLAADRLAQSKYEYVRTLTAEQEPSLGDWLSWATAPAKRAEWAHRFGESLDWLLYGSDILEVRRRVAQRKERDGDVGT